MLKTTVVVILFLAALLAGVFSRGMPSPSAVISEQGKETFMQRETGMPLDMQAVSGAPMGAYGPSPILGSEPKPVPEKPYDMANDQELFQFQDNRISGDCCPSPFSTDRGCVCLTDQQRRDFGSRFGNRA